jgi:hypothetical protein
MVAPKVIEITRAGKARRVLPGVQREIGVLSPALPPRPAAIAGAQRRPITS